MRFSSNLPKFIAIPFLLVIVVTSVVLFSVAFAILLIPMAIMGFKFWRMIRLAQKQQNVDVIEAQYTVIEKRDDDL
jgi:ABC-type bacteriocin/lantibiotic exporter with double-glycine peptidase domain